MARVMADVKWRAALPLMHATELRRRVRIEAGTRLDADWEAARATERHVCTNRADVTYGQAIADAHGPLLRALATVIDGLDEHVAGAGLAAADEDAIRALADQQAADAHAAWRWRAEMATRLGRPAPALTPADRRRQDPTWQRRRLRRTAGLARQHLAAALGTIGRGGAPYADDYSLRCRRARDAAARAWADGHEWRPPGGGDGVPMSAIRERSDAARLHRLGAMAAGMDEMAKRVGLVPIFVTLTLPPEWHPAPAVGHRSWTIDRGPQATDDALRRRWGRFRARMAKSKIALLGLRVWEPHRDGCPHAHALLYVRPDEIGEVDRHLQEVCPEPPDPPRNNDGTPRRVASTLVVIDRKRSSGATYVMKYLRKTLTPKPTGADALPRSDDDIDADDHLTGDHHDRTRATASERGWRRYATLGVHGMQSVWQRLRTATETEMSGAPARAVAAHTALHSGRWADALEAMGAVRQPGAHRLRLGYRTETTTAWETVDQETGEILPPGTVVPLLDRYGSPCRRAAWLTDTETDGWRLALDRGGSVERRPKAAVVQPETEKVNETKAVTVSDRFPSRTESKEARGSPEGSEGKGDGSGIPLRPPLTPAEWAALEQIEAAWSKIAA